MISFIIYVTVLLSSVYFLFRNRIDFLLVFFLSTLLYHWQIIAGKIILPPYFFKVSNESIIIVSTVLIIHTTVTIFHDAMNNKKITFNDFNVSQKYDLIAYILCFMSLILTFRAIYIVGFDFISKGDYSGALKDANINPIWLHYPAAISLLYATLTKNRILFFLSLIPLSIYGYMGYRAELITALVGCITIYAYNSKFNSLKSIFLGLIVILLFAFFALYKISYYELKDDNVSAVDNFEIRSLYYDSTFDYLKKVFFYNEWGQVSSNLSLSTENDLSEYYDLPKVVVGSIPFAKKLSDVTEDDTRFSRLIIEYANPGFSFKLGGTFWGEAYAGLNIFGVILFSTIVSSLIAFLNNMFYRANPIYLFSILFLSFLSFYIHRNDLTLVFAHLKNIIFLLLISGFIFFILNFLKSILLNVKLPETKN